MLNAKAARAFDVWRDFLLTPPACAKGLVRQLDSLREQSEETFNRHLSGAEPFYVLKVLIEHCDENHPHRHWPRFSSVSARGTWSGDLGDFKLITESDIKRIEDAEGALKAAGVAQDDTSKQRIQTLKESFARSLPDCVPLPSDGTAERAILYAELKIPAGGSVPEQGQHGDYGVNTAMVLLSRHIHGHSPRQRQGYTTIAYLLQAFCLNTFSSAKAALNKDSVRQRIKYAAPKVEEYCEQYERLYPGFARNFLL